MTVEDASPACSLMEGTVLRCEMDGRRSSVTDFLATSLSLDTSTWALKYSSRQSSSFSPLPSTSGGTAKFSNRSCTTLWSSSSFLP